jgi:hypothetical protein
MGSSWMCALAPVAHRSSKVRANPGLPKPLQQRADPPHRHAAPEPHDDRSRRRTVCAAANQLRDRQSTLRGHGSLDEGFLRGAGQMDLQAQGVH